jgi:hypothetical protein
VVEAGAVAEVCESAEVMATKTTASVPIICVRFILLRVSMPLW